MLLHRLLSEHTVDQSFTIMDGYLQCSHVLIHILHTTINPLVFFFVLKKSMFFALISHSLSLSASHSVYVSVEVRVCLCLLPVVVL